jgi:hypothetical protein
MQHEETSSDTRNGRRKRCEAAGRRAEATEPAAER